MTRVESPEPLPSLPTGVYRHYKGERYEVYGVARHSETLEAVVVYRPLYGEGALWVRPFEMFTGRVDVDGVSRLRFELETPQAAGCGLAL